LLMKLHLQALVTVLSLMNPPTEAAALRDL
jgi:hypothetical protein